MTKKNLRVRVFTCVRVQDARTLCNLFRFARRVLTP